MSGAGFPAFLAASFPLREITDRRGECIYAACPHYRTCFIERAVRRARHARIVIANHALVIAQAAQDWLAGDETTDVPPSAACATSSTKAIICSMRPIPASPPFSPARRWPICGAGFAGPRAAPAPACAGLKSGSRIWSQMTTTRTGRARRSGVRGRRAGRRRLDRSVWAAARRAGPAKSFWPRCSSMCARAAKATTASIRSKPTPNRLGDGVARRRARARARAQAPGRAPAALVAGAAQAARRQGRRARALHPRAHRCGGARRRPARQDHPAGLDRDARCARDRRSGARNSSTGSRSRARTGAMRDVGLWRHWVDPTMPLTAEVLAPAHGALITSATLRDAEVAETQRTRRLAIGRSAHGRGPSARTAAPRQLRLALRLCKPGARLHRQGRHRAAIRRRWPRPIANCFWRRAAARSASSPRCVCCARSKAASPRRSPKRA